MSHPPPTLLAVNGGSSSLKLALFTATPEPARLLTATVQRLGTPQATLELTDHTADLITGHTRQSPLAAASFADALPPLIAALRAHLRGAPVLGIAHRIVHGGLRLTAHQPVTPELLAELRRTQPVDRAHLPREIALIEAFAAAFPGVPQIACFDTAFHRDLPRIARLLPIPRKYLDAGVRKLGFHGLSYTYLLAELSRVAGPDAAAGRVILAHLGAGASMAAVHHGKPVDTTMAFTPTSGLVMATRPGDLDPGLLLYLQRDLRLSADDMETFITQHCGLLGVSDSSPDLRDLLAAAPTNPHAADALALFSYQARKHLAALTAPLGGLDTLVFSGGIGEHSPETRAAVCQNLTYLGITLDPAANAKNKPLISPPNAPVTVRVLPTDEELTLARIALPPTA